MGSKKYTPTRFMAEGSHYDKARADHAVNFIECLVHTKGRWSGQKFSLLPYQETIIRDIFGVIKEDGTRQFRTAYIEVPKKNGKSELAAAVALYLLFADGEASPEVYGAAADRKQAGIVFNVAAKMAEANPMLMKRCKILEATKQIKNFRNNGVYQVLSAEVGTKHGLNVSGLVFDELHTQPNRKLYDVLTKMSGDSREQPLYFLITTAGNDLNSICYEVHQKAVDIIEGRKNDPSFYPVVYSAAREDDWKDPEVWKKANPSLGHTIKMEAVEASFQEALNSPADEYLFRQLRLCQWQSVGTRWMQMDRWDECSFPVDEKSLEGRTCFAGLDLSSTTDITALVLVFPPEDDDDKYIVLPYFWLPEETLDLRVRRDHVPYDVWEKQGYIMTTEGDVVYYEAIRAFINKLYERFNIREIAVDRWNASMLIQALEDDGFTMVPFGQGFASMSAPSKELLKLVLEKKIAHGGNPVLRWMADNMTVRTDPAGNIKPDKEKSVEKIDGIVATVMALDRAIKNGNQTSGSVYDERGLLIF